MGWMKIIFYFMVIYFNFSILRTNILLGIGLIAVEVIIFGKVKGNYGSSRGSFYKRDDKKIEKLLNTLIMLELMRMEGNPINRGREEDSINIPTLSDSYKKIKNTFSSGGFYSNTEPQIESSEPSDISGLVNKFHNQGDFRGIIRIFLGLIRLISKTLIFRMHGNGNIRKNNDKCYPFFERLGKIFQNTYNLNYLSDKLDKLKIIELRTKNSASGLSTKIMKEDAEYLINLYFSLKNFNPIALKTDSEKRNKSALLQNMQYLSPVINLLAKNNESGLFKGGNSQMLIPESFAPIMKQFLKNKFQFENDRIKSDLYRSGNINQALSDFDRISFSHEPISRLSTKFRRPDSIDEITYECLKKFLLGFAIFIGFFGGIILSQVLYLPEASGYFQSSGIMFIIVSAVSVYISWKI